MSTAAVNGRITMNQKSPRIGPRVKVAQGRTRQRNQDIPSFDPYDVCDVSENRRRGRGKKAEQLGKRIDDSVRYIRV